MDSDGWCWRRTKEERAPRAWQGYSIIATGHQGADGLFPWSWWWWKNRQSKGTRFCQNVFFAWQVRKGPWGSIQKTTDWTKEGVQQAKVECEDSKVSRLWFCRRHIHFSEQVWKGPPQRNTTTPITWCAQKQFSAQSCSCGCQWPRWHRQDLGTAQGILWWCQIDADEESQQTQWHQSKSSPKGLCKTC